MRDRAILELLFATGIRRKELASLTIADIDFDQARLLIRHGKGGKERLVPIATRALEWLDKYLQQARPLLTSDPDQPALFLAASGLPLVASTFQYIIKTYVQAAGINKPGSCHALRHAMATAMLDNGADIRNVQEILGHSDLQTTQIYTKVAIRKLKEVHTKTHPARSQKHDQPAD